MIFTSYFARAVQLPRDYVVISIARPSPPPPWKGLEYKRLVPTWKMFYEEDKKVYEKEYREKVLAGWRLRDLIDEFNLPLNIGENPARNIVLCCYERPEKFSNRHIVADWIREKEGVEVYEYKYT